jgi:hypothetical protein
MLGPLNHMTSSYVSGLNPERCFRLWPFHNNQLLFPQTPNWGIQLGARINGPRHFLRSSAVIYFGLRPLGVFFLVLLFPSGAPLLQNAWISPMCPFHIQRSGFTLLLRDFEIYPFLLENPFRSLPPIPSDISPPVLS